MAEFTLSLEKFIKKAGANADAVFQKACLGITKDIISDTPVDSGRLKGNWQPSIGTPKSGVLENPTQDKGISETASMRITAKDTFYLTNNLPYAGVVEYGLYPNPPAKGKGKTINGFSTQAPQGMVRKNLLRWQEIVNQAVNRLVH